MAGENDVATDSGVTEGTTDTSGTQSGQEFADSCASAGISVDFGSLPEIVQNAWWNQQAEKYKTVDAFISGHGLTQGQSVSEDVVISGDSILGDAEYPEKSVIRVLTTQGYYDISVSAAPEELYVSDPGVQDSDGFYYYVHIRGEGSLNIAIEKDGEFVDGYSKPDFFDFEVQGPVYLPGEHYAVVKYKTYGSESPRRIDVIVTRTIRYWTRYPESGGVYEEYSLDVSPRTISFYLPDDIITQTGVITITLDASGTGGGSGGATETLHFTAVAGLSGRHCDPINGDTTANHPIDRSEVPAYGSGGYGGHGGGGGAGASTVVIYKFDSGKADSVEQIAIAKRHGYGSGGGAGGRGGDGCILIFW